MAFDFTETVTIELPDVEQQLSAFTESDYRKNHGLIIEVAAIHEGLTANYNMYTAEALEEALASWVTPYPKPIILNHDLSSEPMGRVMAAKMAQEADGTPYVMLQIAVTDPEAIAKVSDQRYLTGSVGGKATEAKCSICEADWSNASITNLPCRHSRGKTYKGKLAYLEVGGISFREYSFVNVPADQQSSIRKIRTPGAEVTAADESTGDDDDWVRAAKVFSLNMNEQEVLEFSESEDGDVLEEMSSKEAAPVYMQIKGAFLSAMAVASFDEADSDKKKKPYGDVKYADPGYQSDNKKRYPLDTKDHVRAAWSYINQKKNASKYTPEQLKQIKARIKAAAKRMGISVSDNEESIVDVNTMEDEDILAVAEELSSDLASSVEEEEDTTSDAEASTDEEQDTSDGEVDEESTDDEEEETDSEEEAKNESEEEESESSEGDEEEDSEEETDTKEESEASAEDTDGDDDSEEEDGEAAAEESDSDAELSEEISTLESRVEELEAKRDALQDENNKLRGLLKQNLAERVVDMKIAKGLMEEGDRSASLEDHAKRSAASLADSLRDLAALPSQTRSVDTSKVPSVEEKSSVKDTGEPVNDDGDGEAPEENADPEERFTSMMVERLMGKRSF